MRAISDILFHIDVVTTNGNEIILQCTAREPSILNKLLVFTNDFKRGPLNGGILFLVPPEISIVCHAFLKNLYIKLEDPEFPYISLIPVSMTTFQFVNTL